MDAATVISSILAVATMSNKVISLVSRATETAVLDPSLKILENSFKNEQRVLQTWLENTMRNQTPFTNDNLEQVREILGSYERAAEQAERQFRKIMVSETSGKKLQQVFQRMEYQAEGLEELANTVELLGRLNRALEIVAPPQPPKYDGGSNRWSNPGTQRDSTYGTLSGSSVLSTTPPNLRDTYHIKVTGVDATSDGVASSVTLATGYKKSVFDLWRASIQAMTVMMRESRDNREVFSVMQSRLHLWGMGLFTGKLNLDALIEHSVSSRETMREFMIMPLVEIMITQGYIFDRWLASSQDRLSIRNASFRLRAVLIDAEVLEFVNEEWMLRMLQQDYKPITETDDISFLRQAIEVLFEMLPAVRSLRQQRLLDDTRYTGPRISATISGDTLPFRIGQESALDDVVNHLDDNFSHILEIEAALKARAQRSDESTVKTDRAYSGMVTKERERLEEWRLQKHNKRLSSEVLKVQTDVSHALRNTLATIGAVSLTGPKKAFSDAKEEKANLNLDDNIADLIKILDRSTSHLFEATS